MSNGLLVDLRSEDDRTPFEHALRARKYDTAKLLLEHGANIDRVRNGGEIVMHDITQTRDYNAAHQRARQSRGYDPHS